MTSTEPVPLPPLSSSARNNQRLVMTPESAPRAQASFIVKNDKGLHTRPATELVKCATRYKASLELRHQNRKANGKSILEILMLEATKGAKITVTAEGSDAQALVDALRALAEISFKIDY